MRLRSFGVITSLVYLVLAGCGSQAGRLPPSGFNSSPGVSAENLPSGPIVEIAWKAPTTNQDGTPLTDLAGYKLYYGHEPGNYLTSFPVGYRPTYRLLGLSSDRTYYIAITARDFAGNESDFSQEIKVTLPSISDAPTLAQAPLMRGQQAHFRVTGLKPGEAVFFLFSTTGIGEGPCSQDLGGLCMDILQPQVFGQRTSNATGAAILSVSLPADAATGQTIFTQAVVRRGAPHMDYIKTNLIRDIVQ